MEETKLIEQPNSVKFGINAKGLFSVEVKCYGITPEDALTKATKIASEVELIIKTKNSL